MEKKLKVIVTGVTGMVGEGVLHECLQSPLVSEVLIISRKEAGFSHPKLKAILHANMSDISALAEQVQGYDACFFCLGVSSVGMKEEAYTKLTYDLTVGFAQTLAKLTPRICFCYVSGAYTDSTEKGRSMWARIKGRTENELMRLFTNAYLFRPGYLRPTPGLKKTLKYYKYIDWLYPVLRKVFPSFIGSLSELGQAMLFCATTGYPKKHLEVADIQVAASKIKDENY